MIAYLFLALAIALIYGPQISPMLGMGPSSILSTAVAAGGFGPVHGYPVHNLISRLFLELPFDRPAYALNVASFVMAVLTILLVTRLIAVLFEYLNGERLHWFGTFIFGIALSFIYFQSPSLARISFWGDRYTTELFFLVAAASFFVDALLNPQNLHRGLRAIAFFCAFIFFCHAKSLALVWFFAAVLLVRCWRTRQLPPVFTMLPLFILGLLAPVLVLYFTSVANPLFDWGNPENLQNIWNSIVRKEFAFINLSRTFDDAMSDLSRQYRMLGRQFSWPVFLLAGLGLFAAFRKNWRFGTLFVGAIILTGEWTSFVQHFVNPVNEPTLAKMYDWLILNYFGPYYVLIALLAVVGISALVLKLPQERRTVAMIALLALSLSLHLVRGGRNSFRSYGMSDELVSNFERALPEGAAFFTNVDSLYSSLIHNQIHHGRLENRYIFNTELMFRSWYFRDIERMYPAFWMPNEEGLVALREHLTKFERDGYVPEKLDYKLLIRTLNNLAEHSQEGGSYAYFDSAIQGLRPGLFANLRWEPEALVFRLVKGSYRISTLQTEGLQFDQLKSMSKRGDIWAERFLNVFAHTSEMRLQRSRLLQSEEVARLEKLLLDLR